MPQKEKKPTRNIAQNKKAWHDYFVDEQFEAGIELFGTEVKSLRAGTVNLKDSYCSFKMARSSPSAFTSALMKRAISLTAIPCVPKSF